MKLKLLNINGYAKLQKNYKGTINETGSIKWNNIDWYSLSSLGSLLDDTSFVFDVPLSRSAEERRNFNSLIETINKLVTFQDYVRVDVNTNMGFIIGI